MPFDLLEETYCLSGGFEKIELVVDKIYWDVRNMEEKRDSYDKFIKHFKINIHDLYEFGIEDTILPDLDAVRTKWENLKYRIHNNESVWIRGYGRDAKGTRLYLDLYAQLFKNNHVKKDPTNNSVPQKIISELTKYKRNGNLLNYQVSHIFGKTKNIYLFEAPWNIAFVPKIIDPFTGHETQGPWPRDYQELYIKEIKNRYEEFITDYNKLINNTDIKEGIEKYAAALRQKEGNTLEIERFEKDALKDLAPI